MLKIPPNPRAWKALRQMIDDIETGRKTVVADPDMCKTIRHAYSLQTVVGLMTVWLCQGLGINIPLVTVDYQKNRPQRKRVFKFWKR